MVAILGFDQTVVSTQPMMRNPVACLQHVQAPKVGPDQTGTEIVYLKYVPSSEMPTTLKVYGNIVVNMYFVALFVTYDPS